MRVYLHHKHNGARLGGYYDGGANDCGWITLLTLLGEDASCLMSDVFRNGYVTCDVSHQEKITCVMRITHPEFTVSFA